MDKTLILAIYIAYIQTSVIWNAIRIQMSTNPHKKRINHSVEDLIQLIGTAWLCWKGFGISWDALFIFFGLLNLYWLLFDPQLNRLRGLKYGYRSKEWYDNVLPKDPLIATLIKLTMTILFLWILP